MSLYKEPVTPSSSDWPHWEHEDAHTKNCTLLEATLHDPGFPAPQSMLCQVSASCKCKGGSPPALSTDFPRTDAYEVRQATTPTDSGAEHTVY